MGVNLSIKLHSVDHFYSEANKLEDTGNMTIWNMFHNGTRYSPYGFIDFVGLPYDEIIKSKYSYKKGLDKLREINQDLNLGGSVKTFKYDEFDGDDVNYDRLLEQLPAFKKRVHTIGSGNGRLINLHVNIGELAFVNYSSLMYRSYTVMCIIDYLENLGYQIGLSIYTDTLNPGFYKGENIDLLHVEVEVKKPDEPLLKPLLLTTISSWMLRYWMFKFRAAKFNTKEGMGSSTKCDYTDTKSDLYIRAGECLNKVTADQRIREIQEYYDNL